MWQKHTNMMGWSHEYTKVTNELTCAWNLQMYDAYIISLSTGCTKWHMNRQQISNEMQTAQKKNMNLHWNWRQGVTSALTNYQNCQQSYIKMSYLQVKKEATKNRSSSPIQWVFPPDFPPGFHRSFAPQHHGPRSGRLTPNHWVTNIASSAWLWRFCWGSKGGQGTPDVSQNWWP